jgi:hypothetical protein
MPQSQQTKKRFAGGPEPVHCANCGHTENEHGRSGTKPCLATVGHLADLGFCLCDEFRPKAKKAA